LLDVVLWLIAIEALSLAVLPLTLRVLFALPDGGYASAKILGLILLGYAAWVTGILGITAFTGATLVAFTALLAAIAWLAWGRQLRAAWTEIRPLAIGAEVTFVVVFLIAVGIRAYNAPIAGQEKEMDFTFLHSLIKTASLPAPDLWLIGYGMPYYYFGYLTQSLLPKVLPIDPAVSYNLALATVLALAACGAFGLVAGLVKLAGGARRTTLALGALAAFALTIMGNLEAFFELIADHGLGSAAFWSALGIKGLTANVGGFPPDGGWWFRAARVIPNIQPDGITEFPYFSFLLGDLHPHYVAIPLGILILALAAHELLVARPLRGDAIRLAVAAIVLGAVIPSNTWDVPIFWGVFALALAASALRRTDESLTMRARGWDLLFVVLLAVVCYAPYRVGYVAQPLGVALVDERTMFGSLFVLFGPLIVLAFAGGIVGLLMNHEPEERGALGRWALLVGTAAGAALLVARQPTLGFLVASLIFWSSISWQRATGGGSASRVATALLTLAGLGSILIPEVVYLRDVFGTRMNTVFKFYYDAWILLALAAPLILWELGLVARSRAANAALWARPVAATAIAGSAALIGVSAIYPVAATWTKSGAFAGAATLDGMVHIRNGRTDDAAAIDWLRRLRPTVGVVEAVGNDYSDAGRFSTFAGLPTLVGWTGHELQWRGTSPEVDARKDLARRVYTDPNARSWRPELERLGIRYVVVGSMEREIYGQSAGADLGSSLPVAQRLGSTTIYEVSDRGQ